VTRVVDTSVVLAWYVEEDASEAAIPYLGTPLIAPDLIMTELSNAVWKKVRRGEISDVQAVAIFGEAEATIVRVPHQHVLSRALELALTLRHPVYDCIFLAFAEAADTTLITADRRFAEACRGTAHARRLEVIR
jgi:predicted nucleic acid-binding protein